MLSKVSRQDEETFGPTRTDIEIVSSKLRITNVGDLNFKPIAGVRFPGRVKTSAVVPPPCRSNESQIARFLPRQVLFFRAGRGR